MGVRLVGTLVVVGAAACIGEVGPPDASVGPSIQDLMQSPLLWPMCGVFMGLGVASCAVIMLSKDKLSVMIAYSVFVAVPTAVGSSVGKILTMPMESNERYIFLALYGILGLGSLGGGAKASEVCDLAVYLPTNECMKLIMNAVIGKVIWQDIPNAPTAYVMVLLIMCLGVYLCARPETPVPEIAKFKEPLLDLESECEPECDTSYKINCRRSTRPSMWQVIFGNTSKDTNKDSGRANVDQAALNHGGV